MGQVEFRKQATLAKVDRKLGLVLGWAVLSKVDGEPYFDLQGDHVTDEALLEASTDFMMSARTAKAMHTGSARGTVVFAWPMTEEVAKAYGIDTGGKYGLMVAVKYDEDVLAKFESGEFTGFSIGGWRGRDREVSE